MRLAFFITISAFLFGCNTSTYEGYKDIEKGIYLKVHVLGDGEKKPSKGDFIKTIFTVRDSLNDKIYEVNTPYYFVFGDKNQNLVNKGFSEFLAGDSVTFKVSKNQFPVDSIRKKIKTNQVYLDLKILNIQSPSEYKEELEYMEWVKDQELNERVDLLNYLAENKIDADKYLQGIYYVELKKGRGKYLEKGDVVYLHYKGIFVDGTEFDNTRKGKEPLEWHVGDPEQVIKGFEIGLSMMKKGGKSLLVIPSQLAFGDKGSSSGIVPPFKTVIYEVEILKI